MKNKLVLGITIAGAIPRIKNEVIPAFKEKGFVAGVKAAAHVVARTTVDFVSNAGFSAVGRAIGTTLGSVCPGVGNVIGGMLGDAVGSCISMRLTNKIFDKDKTETQEENNTDAVDTNTATENTPQGMTGDAYLDEKINKALSR